MLTITVTTTDIWRIFRFISLVNNLSNRKLLNFIEMNLAVENPVNPLGWDYQISGFVCLPIFSFKQKYQTWEKSINLSSSAIFPISRSIFHQIIKSWIFSKSTQKGLLKNVQDGISRPLGSLEIQKTKVETDLLDTLYNIIHITLQ